MTTPFFNLRALEALARERLPEMAYDYYASGAHDEITLRENERAFERIALRYRVLVDVSRRDMATRVLGQDASMPVLIAPTAFQCMAHPEGELATARAAGAAGTIMILSTLANTAIEDVVRVATGPVWFQLYVYKDRGATAALVKRAEAAGAQAIILTVDAPMLGRRECDVRASFALPAGLTVKNLTAEGLHELPRVPGESGLAAYVTKMLDPSLTWKDVDWLRGLTKLPLLLKGIIRADDAERAVEHGANGIVVSNHGGRQLDTAPATIRALAAITEKVNGRIDVLLDGGVRRGTDVLKAIALGARAVLLGRPVLWGLAVGGEAGVTRALEILRAEIDLAMALSGCASLEAVTRDLLLE